MFQSVGSHRVRYNLATEQQEQNPIKINTFILKKITKSFYLGIKCEDVGLQKPVDHTFYFVI